MNYLKRCLVFGALTIAFGVIGGFITVWLVGMGSIPNFHEYGVPGVFAGGCAAGAMLGLAIASSITFRRRKKPGPREFIED